MKKLLAAFLLFMTTTINAQTIDLDDVNVSESVIVEHGTNDLVDTDVSFDFFNGSRTFHDTIKFSILSLSSVDLGVLDIESQQNFFGFSVNYDISDLTLTFGGMNYSDGDSLSAYLAAGDYTAYVSGTVYGLNAGEYEFTVNVSPVPEASTLSLMVAGFGLVGFMSRRRKMAA